MQLNVQFNCCLSCDSFSLNDVADSEFKKKISLWHSTSINLQYGPYTHEEPVEGDTVALHLDVRHVSDTVVRNHFEVDGWGEEESSDFPAMLPGEAFLIEIKSSTESFAIQINGANIGEFKHRVPFQDITHMFVFHDCTINSASLDEQKLNAVWLWFHVALCTENFC